MNTRKTHVTDQLTQTSRAKMHIMNTTNHNNEKQSEVNKITIMALSRRHIATKAVDAAKLLQ